MQDLIRSLASYSANYFFSSGLASDLDELQHPFLEEDEQSFLLSQFLLSFFFFLSPPSGRFTEKDLFAATDAFTEGASVIRTANITLRMTFFICVIFGCFLKLKIFL